MASRNAFAILDDSDDERPKVAAPSAPAKRDEGARRTNNNDRNTKGGRGPREAREGKRTYDRRSGTGRGKETKKGGGGARNWGSDKQEAKKAEGHVDENQVGESPADVVEEPAVEEVVEEEDNTMTLEEYLAAKKGNAGDSLFGSKKERSIETENDFAGKEPAKFVEEDFLVLGAGKAQKKKKEKKEVQKLDLNFRVASGDKPSRDDDRRGGRGGRSGRGDRGRGDRGGRGRGRGERRSGGRGGGRGRGINVQDANAFPSL